MNILKECLDQYTSQGPYQGMDQPMTIGHKVRLSVRVMQYEVSGGFSIFAKKEE